MARQVLLIDGEEATSFFLRQALEEDGYQVLWSRTGKEGLGTLTRQSVDLILLELELPDADGLEVLRTLRAGARDGPGVLVIGPGSVGDAVEAMRLGAADYLEKPVDLTSLRQAVSRALRDEDPGSSGSSPSTDELLLTAERETQVEEGAGWPAEDPAAPTGRGSRRARSLQRRAEALARLDDLTLRLLTADGADQAVAATLDAALDLRPVGRAAMFLLDASRDEYRLVDQKLFSADAFREKASRRLHVGYGLIQRLRDEGQPVLLEEDGADPWYRGVVSSLPAVGPGALVPVHGDGELIGVLLVVSHPGRTLSAGRLEELARFGDRLGVGLAWHRRESGRSGIRSDQAAGRRSWEAWRAAPQAVAVLDGEGRVVVASRLAERLLGDPTDLAGRTLDSLLGSEILPPMDSPSTRWMPWREEVEVQGRRLGVSLHPWEGEFGPGSVVLLVDRDAEARLDRERERAGHGSALETISAMVAHEIRNPLAGIVTGIQHLAGQSDPDEPGHAGLQMILQESLRVKRVIEELLLLSRPMKLQPVPTDLGEALRVAVETCRPQAESRGSEIAVHLDLGLGTIRGDPDALQRAFRHLLLALLGGTTGSAPITATAVIDSDDDVRYAEVEIQVAGATETSSSGLEGSGRRFSVEEGAPLGLAVARRIIEAHGGEIQSERGPKGIAAFVVRLPIGG